MEISKWNWSAERRTAIGDVANQSLEYVAERLLESRKRAFEAERTAQSLQTKLDSLKAAHAWIKTSERKPDVQEGDCCDVLAVVSEQVLALNYTNDDSVHPWVDEFSNLYQDYEVTHWMPLPEAPK
jgi:hypothetical protein